MWASAGSQSKPRSYWKNPLEAMLMCWATLSTSTNLTVAVPSAARDRAELRRRRPPHELDEVPRQVPGANQRPPPARIGRPQQGVPVAGGQTADASVHGLAPVAPHREREARAPDEG